MMEPFTVHEGSAMVLRRSNVDTDQILPAQYLQRTTRSGFGNALFARWRQDPEFCLNDPRYVGASILVAGENFGTGSSREHAVWALQQSGFRAIVSSRFGDIFRNNAANSGLLTAEVDKDSLDELMGEVEASPRESFVLDLQTQAMSRGGVEHAFRISAEHRTKLLLGVDAITETLEQIDTIAQFERGRTDLKPTVRRS